MSLEDLLKRIDANALGEFLRAATFVGEGIGCYNSFDLVPEALEFQFKTRRAFWYSTRRNDGPPYGERLDFAREAAELGRGCTYEIDGYRIDMCYYWDGDGILAFKVYNPDNACIANIINGDCKKPSCWEHMFDRDRMDVLQ